MDVDSEEGEKEHDSGEDGVDTTMPDAEDFRNAYYEAYKLCEIMEYMDDMAHHDEKENCDCLFSLVSYDDALLRPALEVLGMNPNKVDDGGDTPLYAAMLHAKPFAVKLLLANGSNPFHCNDVGWFPMGQGKNTPDSINCSLQLNTFIENLVDKRHTTSKYLEDKARLRMKKVHKYKFLIENLLEINKLKDEIFATMASDEQLYRDLDDVKTLLHDLEPLALCFDNHSLPGVTKLHTDSTVQQWYIDNELSKINWSQNIKMYFTRGVARMEKLHSICRQDKSRFPVDILHMLTRAKTLLAICERNRDLH
jgi:hypothetical protein